MYQFSDKDLKEMKAHGVTEDQVREQLKNFENGFPYIVLLEAATRINGGILYFDEKDANTLIALFDKEIAKERVVKFVPASGAASRMFKSLYEFVNGGPTTPSVNKVLNHLPQFAFYNALKTICSQKGIDLEKPLSESTARKTIHLLLEKEGLNYGEAPKGVLLFHDYGEEIRSAIEEHMVEGASYVKDGNGRVALHFTVSPEHLTLFQDVVKQTIEKYEKRFDTTFHITYSTQKNATDTIAVSPDNTPFRNEDGSLLFRPGGHGALLENLNDLPYDTVFIKNIDNVVPDRLKPETIHYKKLIGGYLFHLRNKLHGLLQRLHNGDETACEELKDFSYDFLHQPLPPMFEKQSFEERRDLFMKLFNKPLRVCGMVKNEGEPGGGPFIVEDGSLQIVESSQVNRTDAAQMKIFNGATHFNPVDLVCCLTDYQGKKFDLRQFVDQKTGFISEKSKDGAPLKAQELPGLWNGAMARWITVFVEVPLITFNPVKTVNDLLREEHQA